MKNDCDRRKNVTKDLENSMKYDRFIEMVRLKCLAVQKPNNII